jgi:hypothetical protein
MVTRHNRLKANGPGTRTETIPESVVERTTEIVKAHPTYAALATFAAGCCLGACLSRLLLPSAPSRRWYEIYR